MRMYFTLAAILILCSCELEKPETLNVFFCPQEDCLALMLKEISQAKQGVDCAIYGIGDRFFSNFSKTTIVKRMVLDDHDRHDASFIRKDRKGGLMHNKFCVIDGKKVIAGSFNPTDNNSDHNALLVIERPSLARAYEEEFSELWKGQFGRGNKTLDREHSVNGIQLEVYFCPEDLCKERVEQEIQKARSSIVFAAYSFTSASIATELAIRNENGIRISGVVENRASHTVAALLEFQGIPFLVHKGKHIMHHKFWVIDNATVIVGSFNPTESADERNDENIIIMRDADIAALFLREFYMLNEDVSVK